MIQKQKKEKIFFLSFFLSLSAKKRRGLIDHKTRSKVESFFKEKREILKRGKKRKKKEGKKTG